jgi:hypothetical protein
MHTVPWQQRTRQNTMPISLAGVIHILECWMYLPVLPCIWNSRTLCSKTHISFIPISNIICRIRYRFCLTALFPGDDVYNCSVVPVWDGIVQNECSSVLLLPVYQSHLLSPAVLCHVSVWCLKGPHWASPADCWRHSLA